MSDRLLDSLERENSAFKGLTFVLTLSPIDSNQKDFAHDVVYGKISGYESYKETLNAYQFGLKDKIWIESKGVKIPMLGYQMENTYGVSRSLNFTLLFPSWPGDSENKFRIVLDDIVPGLNREKIEFDLSMRRYAKTI